MLSVLNQISMLMPHTPTSVIRMLIANVSAEAESIFKSVEKRFQVKHTNIKWIILENHLKILSISRTSAAVHLIIDLSHDLYCPPMPLHDVSLYTVDPEQPCRFCNASASLSFIKGCSIKTSVQIPVDLQSF